MMRVASRRPTSSVQIVRTAPLEECLGHVMKTLYERLIARALPRRWARTRARDRKTNDMPSRQTGTPSWAQTYQTTFPSRAAADEMADALAVRGHLLVAIREVDHFLHDPSSWWYGKPSLRPDEQDHWDVFSVASGPVPDDDLEWWQAQEDQTVRRLAVRLGGRAGGSGGGNLDQVVRSFARDGLVHELDMATAAPRRLAALAESPARAGEREARAIDDDLPDRSGDAIVLQGISKVDWGALVHAYGPATEVPDLLRGLAANDDRWGDLHNEFVGAVLHQGSTYSASAPALQVLAELANAPGLAPKRRLDLLYTLFLAGSSSAQADAYGYRADDHATEVQTTVIGAVDQLLMLWPSVSRAEQRLLLLLAALAAKPVPESDLNDPASRLALAMNRDMQSAEATLRELATRNEDLIELADSPAPLRSRLVAALERLLWEP